MLSEHPGDSPLKYQSNGLADCESPQALLSVSPVSEFCAERLCESLTTLCLPLLRRKSADLVRYNNSVCVRKNLNLNFWNSLLIEKAAVM